jgi:hypothetical protein
MNANAINDSSISFFIHKNNENSMKIVIVVISLVIVVIKSNRLQPVTIFISGHFGERRGKAGKGGEKSLPFRTNYFKSTHYPEHMGNPSMSRLC